MTDIIEQAGLAKRSSKLLRLSGLETRNGILQDFADGIIADAEKILSANAEDCREAEQNGMRQSMLDRLRIDSARLNRIAEGIRDLIFLPDPIHQILEERTLRSGLYLKKISVPLGVVGIIYESRPNVTADCAALCIKSGNACVLKGGKESYATSRAIIDVCGKALEKHGLDKNCVVLAERISHEDTARLMSCRQYLDVLIPRGSRRLIQSVIEHAKVPVIETGAGICHVYVENSADPAMAENIILNAKCQRPSVCNAMETLLVEDGIADTFIPHIADVLQEHHVTMYGDEKCVRLSEKILPVKEDSYDTEYNDLIMNMRVVPDTEAAIAHIETHGTHHSESIISENDEEVQKFMNGIDSACLYHNASTRFTDGYEFGLGAEIGISTQKLHARGPMGLRALTTYTYQLEGKGEIRK